MRNIKLFTFLFLLTFPVFVSAQSGMNTKILVHYMPWYQSREISGYWGWHWTMNHYNPDFSSNGRKNIASHYYPITGPYDSADPDILEYQVLLMKLSGVDGVIVDWYGMEDYGDYGVLNKSTNKLFDYIKKARLLFSICYEDQTIKHMIEKGHLTSAEAKDHGKTVMKYMEDNWFKDDAYCKLSGQPLLLNFGPKYFQFGSDWISLFSVLETKPQFFTLDRIIPAASTGAFPWPPMGASVNGVLSKSVLNNYLTNFYLKSQSWPFKVASAFPAFHDIYAQANVGNSYGYLDADSGNVFRNTLKMAFESDPDIVQIVTWNDYGEGTIVEPTLEFGYKYLEMIQDARKGYIDNEFPFIYDDLKIPFELYTLRKNNKLNPAVNSALDRVFLMIIDGSLQAAAETIDSLNSVTSVTEPGMENIREKWLNNLYPNPFNISTSINFYLPENSFVELEVYNVLGTKVDTIERNILNAGSYSFEWNATNQSSGIYFVKMRAGNYIQTEKVILLK